MLITLRTPKREMKAVIKCFRKKKVLEEFSDKVIASFKKRKSVASHRNILPLFPKVLVTRAVTF